jgi:hypothetical protein
MRLNQCHLVAALVVLLSLWVPGCAHPKSNVKGTVTLDGKPLYAGKIVFITKGAPAVSGEIKEGQYAVEGVPTGEAAVTVDNDEIKILVEQAKKVSRGPAEGTMAGKAPPGAQMSPEAKAALEKQAQATAEAVKHNRELVANFQPVPDKYRDPNSSGLKFTVGSSSTFDVPLTSK